MRSADVVASIGKQGSGNLDRSPSAVACFRVELRAIRSAPGEWNLGMAGNVAADRERCALGHGLLSRLDNNLNP